MAKTALTGQSQTINIEENIQAIVLENVGRDATIQVTVQKEGQADAKPYPTMKLGHALEFQAKIQAILSNKEFLHEVVEVNDTGAGKVPVFPLSLIHIMQDGELEVGDNDKVIVKLANMGNVASDSSLTPFEGKTKGEKLVDFKKLTYLSSRDEKEIDVANVDFVAFDVIPDEINLTYEKEVRRIDALKLKAINLDNFGQVRKTTIGSTVTDSFGSAELYVLDVRGVQIMTVKDETQTSDFNILTANIFQ